MIENSNFLIKEVPRFGPFSVERVPWWREQRRRLIEGFWSGGKWMPPNLYQYVNFWHIKLSEDEFSKSKKKGKPSLRDLEWEKSYIFQEAKGFSGFSEDAEVTCHRSFDEKNREQTQELFPTFFNLHKGKKFIPAREYLRTVFNRSNLGKPLYENQASNVIDVEARTGGKSYMAANNISHNFITDGAIDYDRYLEARRDNKEFTSETVVGAFDSKWSADLLSKVRYGMDNFEGGMMFQQTYYPSPISRMYRGVWKEGGTVEIIYDKKEGGTWVSEGTGTKIQHRTFRNNPFAAAGTRPNIVYIEEIGFMKNLTSTIDALRDCTMDGDVKFGMIWAMGTGGDMVGGATAGAKDVMYNPAGYDCLEFDDIYEGRGMIGLFIPSHMTLNRYKDSEGITDKDKAKRSVDLDRVEAKKKSRQSYNSILINRPEVPSEAFLLEGSNIFDTAAIDEHIGWLESMQHDALVSGQCGDLIINSEGIVEWIHDIHGKLVPNDFPIKKGKQAEGCIQIWEHPPDGVVPYGRYVASTDPYDQDKAPNTTSVGSTFILKLLDPDRLETSFTIVAEYSGRPASAKGHHEKVRRLLMYYNARDLYENERNTIKMHFEQKKSLYLLMDTPTIMKVTVSKATSKGRGNKGIHMTVPIREELELYARDYLEENTPTGGLYLNTIRSIPLLKELKDYSLEGNFDRCISFFLLILAKQQMYHVIHKKAKERKRDAFFDRRKFVRGEEMLEMEREVDVDNNADTFFKEVVRGDRKPLIPGLFKQSLN